MATSEPDIRVEIAWTGSYADPDPEWTDISEYVQGFTTARGRDNELAQTDAGTVTLTIDNTGGEFTPGNAASPFYPNVKPRRQVRVRDASRTPVKSAQVLENLSTNPRVYGDEREWSTGIAIAGDSIPVPLTVPDQDWVWYIPIAGTTAGTRLQGLTEPNRTDLLPAPGEGSYVSACFDVSIFGDEDTSSVSAVVGVEWFDSDSNSLGVDQGTAVEFTPATAVGRDTDFWYGYARMDVGNAVVPSGAAYYVPGVFLAEDAATDSWQYATSLGCRYVSDSEIDWTFADYLDAPLDGSVFPVVGPYFQADGLSSGWTGVEDLSTSAVYTVSTSDGELGRGYVESWPATYTDLVPEISVTISDWFGDLSTRYLVLPYEYEFNSRGPKDLFRFDESGSDFRSSLDSTRKAEVRLSFKSPLSPAYAAWGGDAPTIAGGGSTILPDALGDLTSAQAQNQGVADGGAGLLYQIGASLAIPVDLNCSTTSWSMVMAYQYNSSIVNSLGVVQLDPFPFVFKDSKFGTGRGEFRCYINGAAQSHGFHETNANSFAPDGTSYGCYGLSGTSVEGTQHVFMLSWDHVSQTLLVTDAVTIPQLESLGLGNMQDPYINVAEFATWNPNGSRGDDVDASVAFAPHYFDTLHVLGYTADVYGGYADHQVQFLGLWDRALTVQDMRHIAEATTNRKGESAGSRISHIFNQLDWPIEFSGVDFDGTSLGPADWSDGGDALTPLKQIEQDTFGNVFVDGGGVVRYRSKDRRINAPVKWTFDCGGATGIETGAAFTSDEQDIQNDVTVTNYDGVVTEVKDADSVSEYGGKAKSYTLNVDDGDYPFQFAYRMVNRYGEAIVRVDGLVINPAASADGALWDAALGVEVGDLIEVTGLPSNAPAETMRFYIESVSHTVVRDGARFSWTTAFDVSPGSGVWDAGILGDSVLGVLGSTAVLVI